MCKCLGEYYHTYWNSSEAMWDFYLFCNSGFALTQQSSVGIWVIFNEFGFANICVRYSGSKDYLCSISGLSWGRRGLWDVGGGGRAVLSGRGGRGKHLRHHRLVLLPRRFLCGSVSWALYTSHTTNCKHMDEQSDRDTWDRKKGTKANTETLILTWGASMEVVVVLWDVCQDTEAVRDLKSHHVFCIQQCWNSQLLLRNLEGLQKTSALSNKTDAAQGEFLASRPSGQRLKWINKSHEKQIWLSETSTWLSAS